MSARSSRSFYMHLAIPGWQGRVEDHHDVELRDALTHETVLAITPAQAIAMLAHYVSHARLTAELLTREPSIVPTRLPLASAPSRATPRALGVPLRPVQEARRAARRAKSAHKKKVG